MKVLVACEFSGVVRESFAALGYNAWSCDVLPTEDRFNAKHLQCDVLTILDQGWDLIIAHPPCTYLTNAGVRHLHESVTSPRGNRAKVFGTERMEAMKDAARFFLALWNAPTQHICIENPIPHSYAREIIGDYTQLIQPWQFGHGETKATCFWLKNLPPLMPTHRRDDLFCAPEPSERVARVHLMAPGPNRWKERSRTFTGIAKAMAEQWGSAITKNCACGQIVVDRNGR